MEKSKKDSVLRRLLILKIQLIKMQICDVAIVGCGLGGLSTAIGIRRVGHCVTIYEKASDLHEVC